MDGGGNDSPPSRTTILGLRLLRRPRNSSQTHINTNDLRDVSPSSPQQPPSPNTPNPSRRRTGVPAVVTHSNSNLGITQMLRRRRSAGNVAQTPVAPMISSSVTAAAALGLGTYNNNHHHRLLPAHLHPGHPTMPNANNNTTSTAPNANANHRIRLVPHLDSRRSLRFDPIGRDLKEGDPPLRIGRFTDRSGLGLASVNAFNSNKLAFRSKVVSRAHAEVWVESGGRFLVKDTKSSSGTFLNHVRLSPANTESRPHQIKDGDILQLGVDYQGGAEDIYKSVKIRVEIGREWQAGANAFNTNALKTLKAISVPVAGPGKQLPNVIKMPSSGKLQIPDCCICLFSVTIRQALFIAPCSHTFHFKCIRPMIESHHPSFSCPLCRTYADLEEDVEVEIEYEDDADAEEVEAGLGGPDKDGIVDDESPVESDQGHAVETQPTHPLDYLGPLQQHDVSMAMEDQFPTRSNSVLGLRGGVEGGAETEVEESLGFGTASRVRMSRRGASLPQAGGSADRASPPLAPDFADEDDEMVVDILHPMNEMGILIGAGGEGVGETVVDLDGTVGGKRKR